MTPISALIDIPNEARMAGLSRAQALENEV